MNRMHRYYEGEIMRDRELMSFTLYDACRRFAPHAQ